MNPTLRLILLALALPFIVTGVLCAEVVRARKEIDMARLVWALCQVENGKWGYLGGAANMKESTWGDRTHLPYSQSRVESVCLGVYAKHIRWLVAGLEADGLKPTVAHIATCWQMGLTAGVARIRYGTPSVTAQNCQNLYESK